MLFASVVLEVDDRATSQSTHQYLTLRFPVQKGTLNCPSGNSHFPEVCFALFPWGTYPQGFGVSFPHHKARVHLKQEVVVGGAHFFWKHLCYISDSTLISSRTSCSGRKSISTAQVEALFKKCNWHKSRKRMWLKCTAVDFKFNAIWE